MRSLNPDQLKTLIEVVEHGGFSAAARRLHLSQPAVSLQVRELEDRLGVKLVERIGKRAYASAAGAELIGHARLIGSATAYVLKQRRLADLKQPPLTDDEMDALYEALGRVPRQFRHYGIWKVRLDPVYPLALPLLAYRKQIVDLGAGMGLMGLLTHARFPAINVRCVEWDQSKVEMARKLLEKIPDVSIEHGDARTVALGSPDAICLFDVLHYSPIEEQRAWLTRCVTALAPGGMVVVRELDPERGSWGLAEQIERSAVKRGWNQGDGIHPWPISQLAQALRDLGLEVEVKQAGRGVFSANALVVARKPSAAGVR